MSLKFIDVINNLNLSFGKAIITLKKAGLIKDADYYTHETLLSEEQYDVLLKLSIKRKKKKEESNSINHKKTESSKLLKREISPLDNYMLNSRSFTSCETYNKKEFVDIITKIENNINLLENKDIKIIALPLFDTIKISKGIKVSRIYYYYTMSLRKKIVKSQCLATWLASKLSGALNDSIISKKTYYTIYKTQLNEYLKQIKTPSSHKKNKTWYSVVSVPFGGMNRN